MKCLRIVYSILVFACIGSFINVVIYRIPKGISIAKGRSYCPVCHHSLGVLDLIPVISYLCLKGRCRYCCANIPVRDTVVEFISMIYGIFCLYLYGFHFSCFLIFLIGEILLALSLIDMDNLILPDELNLALFICASLLVLQQKLPFIDCLLGMILVSFPMLFLNLLNHQAFGYGDVKLMMAAGWLLGSKRIILAFLIGVLSGGFYAVYLLITHKAHRSSKMPFGPFLCLGILISLFMGWDILDWYLSFI